MTDEQNQEPGSTEALNEESQSPELDNVEENALADADATPADDANAENTEPSHDSASDESLTNQSTENESIDWEAKFKEAQELAHNNHKRAVGWDKKYREKLGEFKDLQQKHEEIQRQLEEREQIKQAPVWDRRNPDNADFMGNTVPRIQMAENMLARMPDGDAKEAARASIVEQFSESDLQNYAAFKQHQIQRNQRFMAGDMTPVQDLIREQVQAEMNQARMQQQQRSAAEQVLRDPENMKVYTEHQEKVEDLILSGLPADRAIEVVKNELGVNSMQKQIADLQAQATAAEAQRSILQKNANPPESHTNQPGSIDKDALYEKARKLATEQYGPRPSPGHIDDVFYTLMEKELASQ